MVNFRIHGEKGELTKKRSRSKKKLKNEPKRKKRKKSTQEITAQNSLLDRKVYKDSDINDPNELVIYSGPKEKKKVKKKKRKRLTKKQKDKLEKLKEKRQKKLEKQELFSRLEKSKFDKLELMIPVDSVGRDLTAREKIVKAREFQKNNLLVPEKYGNVLRKKQLRGRGNDEVLNQDGFDEFYYIKSTEKEQKVEEKEKEKDQMDVDDDDKEKNDDNDIGFGGVDEDEGENKFAEFNLSFNFGLPADSNKNELKEDKEMDLKVQETNRITNLNLFKETSISEYIEAGVKRTLSSNSKKTGQIGKKFYKLVERDPEIESHRSDLPIYGMEQEIVETIYQNNVTIICGETGSGKTTQVPQFLYENGYSFKESGFPGQICVTQPRRVAAVSMARRVSQELGTKFGELVGAQIRYFRRETSDTRIKFMTDGILLKELQSDVLLQKYSVIILDEAHERNVNNDLLIGWLSRIVPLRNKKAKLSEKNVLGEPITPIRLIIMSATLRVTDFTQNSRLFPVKPPVIEVSSRQFPVTVHFSKETILGDYVGETFKKVIRIHEKLPGGGVLIFLTGRKEIQDLCERLMVYSKKQRKEKKEIVGKIKIFEDEISKINHEEGRINLLGSLDEGINDDDDVMMFDDGDLSADKETVEILFKNNIKNEKILNKGLEELQKQNSETQSGLYILPLYSKLSPKEQQKVFQKVPKGMRLCVVSTNIAETSLTIPEIRYVVDCGRAKVKEYEKTTGASQLKVQWIPRSSAKQRAGRAGRTSPGHCYRLYSSAVFQKTFQEFAEPEIRNVPIENLVLQMKSMGIINIGNFPFPTEPPTESLNLAEQRLLELGCLRNNSGGEYYNSTVTKTEITQLGSKINYYPVHPRYGKMLVLGKQHGLLDFLTIVVSCLSVGELFLPVVSEKNKGKWYGGESDLLAYLKVAGAYLFEEGKDSFCIRNQLNIKSMREIRKMNKQLHFIENEYSTDTAKNFNEKILPPNISQKMKISQIICDCSSDMKARVVSNQDELNRMKISDKVTKSKMPYISSSLGENTPVYIHPNSYFHGVNPKSIVYSEIVKNKKGVYYMKGITVIPM